MFRRLPIAALAGAALVISPLAVTTAAAAPLSQCDSTTFKKVGGGWTAYVPSEWESTSITCNLKYGDNPHRDPKNPFGDPDPGDPGAAEQPELLLRLQAGQGRPVRRQDP